MHVTGFRISHELRDFGPGFVLGAFTWPIWGALWQTIQ